LLLSFDDAVAANDVVNAGLPGVGAGVVGLEGAAARAAVAARRVPVVAALSKLHDPVAAHGGGRYIEREGLAPVVHAPAGSTERPIVARAGHAEARVGDGARDLGATRCGDENRQRSEREADGSTTE
jgi:hypothetical protein